MDMREIEKNMEKGLHFDWHERNRNKYGKGATHMLRSARVITGMSSSSMPTQLLQLLVDAYRVITAISQRLQGYYSY